MYQNQVGPCGEENKIKQLFALRMQKVAGAQINSDSKMAFNYRNDFIFALSGARKANREKSITT